MGSARLLVQCADQPGIIAAVTGFLAEHGANVVDLDQHTDPDAARFFMRVVFDTASDSVSPSRFDDTFDALARRFSMDWRVAWGSDPTRAAILVTKEGHCLSDLLWRWRTGELNVDVRLVVGNHETLRGEATRAGVPFHYLPITTDTKDELEPQLLDLLQGEDVELVILARYMQILTASTVEALAGRAINIHHSFLPAFAGSRPYHQAHDRGVKVIGATAHFVTAELDSGPIIAQSVAPVDHRDDVADLIRKGRDLERTVLAEAVRFYTEDRILVSSRKTIVFE